ncbi:MAG: nucleoside hydrolase [Pirellulales bacterium]|nr:nucleoside hydrolase [Pirellulales bacterium]
MARKVLLDVDPGIADAMALCLALSNPQLEVVGVTATGGNVTPRQASRNVQTIVEQLDPDRSPRIGAADLDQPLRTDGRQLCGTDGLCGADLRFAELHHRHPSVKVMADAIRSAPGEVTIIAGGPLSNVASLLQREPDLATQVGHLIIVGGTLHGPGDVTAAAEFNIYCDAEAARLVFHSPVTKTLLPLCVTSTVVLDYALLDQLTAGSTNAARVLQAILPGAFRAFRQRLGLEGIYAAEAVAVVSVLHAELLETDRFYGDVETAGGLTHGATVLDRRRIRPHQPNMDVAVQIDSSAAIDCILRGLQKAD